MKSLRFTSVLPNVRENARGIPYGALAASRRITIQLLLGVMVAIITSALIICNIVLEACQVYSARNEDPYSNYYRALIDARDATQQNPSVDRSYVSKSTMSFTRYEYAKQILELFENVEDHSMELFGPVKSNVAPIIPPGGYDKGLQLYGITYYAALAEYVKGEISLTEGRFIELSDHEKQNNVCVISEELALLNCLKVGDTLEFECLGEKTHPLKIVGIFKDNLWRNTQYTDFSNDLTENKVYVPLSVLENTAFKHSRYKGEISVERFDVANFQIKLDDDRLIDEVEAMINEYRLAGGYQCVFVKVSDLFEAENSGIHALENAFTAVMFAFIVISLAVMLIYVYFTVKARRRETGILLAMGADKLYTVLSTATELVIATVLGAGIAYGAAMIYGVPLANKVLYAASSVTSAEAIRDTTSQAYLAGNAESQVFEAIINSSFISDTALRAVGLAALISFMGILFAAVSISSTKPMLLLSGKER